METLAYIHSVLAYEDQNLSSDLRLKNTTLKVASSVAMCFIATGIVASTQTQVHAAQTTLYYGSTGSEVANLQKALGKIAVDGVFGSETLNRLKSYQAKKGIYVDGIAGLETLSSLGLSGLSKNLKAQDVGIKKDWSERVEYGKLHLINDTPYMALVLLYEPGNKHPSRYAYIPPCYERKLLNTYSNSWEISFNKTSKFSIGEKSKKKNKVFKVNLSHLNQEDKSLCDYDNSGDFEFQQVETVSDFFEFLLNTAQERIHTRALQSFKSIIQAFSQRLDEINSLTKSSKKIADSSQESLDFIFERAFLYYEKSKIDKATEGIIASYVRAKNAVNQSDALYLDIAKKIRLKYIAGELDLDNHDEPNKGIRALLNKWQAECDKIQLDLTIPDKFIEEMKVYLNQSQDVGQRLINASLSTDKPNTATLAYAANSRSQICLFAGGRHSIVFTSYIQSQRIPKKCI
jgi:hypothetical protein